MTEPAIHALACEISDRIADAMDDPPNVADVVDVAGRVFCALVGAAGVTLPTALHAVGHLWIKMYGKPGDRAP